MNALSFFAALAFMPWCAAAAGPSSAPAGAELVSIEISPASPELYIDFTVQLAAIGTFSDGTTMDLTDVVWGSSNALVVLVSNAPGSEGLATAITGGTATITAFHADSGLLGSTDILVHEESLMGITVAPLTLSVPVGVIVRFGAFGVLTGGMSIVMTDLVEWSSTDDAVATISNDPGTRGETTTVGAGVADIQATHADTGVSGSTSLFVSTVAPVAVQVTPVSSSVPVGFERSLTATGLFPDGRSYDLTSTASWSSGAPSVMTLDSMEGREGIATGVAAGAAFATATHSASAVSGSTLVTVMDVGLTEIGVAPAGLFLPAGITQPFSASGVFTDGSLLDLTRQVSWASMDEAIATVGDVGETKGRVTGVSMGVTAIEATHTAAGISGTRLMAVTDATLTEIDVSPSDPVLPLALIQAFTATGHFCDATVLDLTTSVRWTPGNPALVTISDVLGTKGHAVVNPIQVGSAAVTARDEASGVTGSSAVSVVDEVLVQVDVAPIDPSIPHGTALGFTATGHFSGGTILDITGSVAWTSSENTVAVIANAVGVAGVATGIGEGVTTIAATGISSSVFGSTSLTVQPVVAVATHQAPRARDVRIFPNPLRARSLQIAVGASRSDPVGVTIYDVTGRRLREIASDPYVPGPRTILWDGRDERGEDVPNGMYFVRLTGGGFRHVGRVTVLR